LIHQSWWAPVWVF